MPLRGSCRGGGVVGVTVVVVDWPVSQNEETHVKPHS